MCTPRSLMLLTETVAPKGHYLHGYLVTHAYAWSVREELISALNDRLSKAEAILTAEGVTWHDGEYLRAEAA